MRKTAKNNNTEDLRLKQVIRWPKFMAIIRVSRQK
jgi:hypothetical protein